jgi:hypothetical protein
MRQIETKEQTYEARMKAKKNAGSQPTKIVAMKTADAAEKKKASA